MSKYRIGNMEYMLRQLQEMKMKHPETGIEVPRFESLQPSDCLRDKLTNTIARPIAQKQSHLRSLSVRLPKTPTFDKFVHGEGSGCGSRESN